MSISIFELSNPGGGFAAAAVGLEDSSIEKVRPPGTSLPYQGMPTSLQVLTNIQGIVLCSWPPSSASSTVGSFARLSSQTAA